MRERAVEIDEQHDCAVSEVDGPARPDGFEGGASNHEGNG